LACVSVPLRVGRSVSGAASVKENADKFGGGVSGLEFWAGFERYPALTVVCALLVWV